MSTIATPGWDVPGVREHAKEAAHPGPGRPRTKGIKAKGTRAETALVALLRASGWPYAERRALNSTTDRGDVAGVPGVVWEAKSGARLCLPDWMRETEVERVNDGAAYGVLVVKPVGVGGTRVGDWPAIMPLGQLIQLLHEAGYGDALDGDDVP